MVRALLISGRRASAGVVLNLRLRRTRNPYPLDERMNDRSSRLMLYASTSASIPSARVSLLSMSALLLSYCRRLPDQPEPAPQHIRQELHPSTPLRLMARCRHVLVLKFNFTFAVGACRPYYAACIQMERAEVATTKSLTQNVAARPEMAEACSEPE